MGRPEKAALFLLKFEQNKLPSRSCLHRTTARLNHYVNTSTVLRCIVRSGRIAGSRNFAADAGEHFGIEHQRNGLLRASNAQ